VREEKAYVWWGHLPQSHEDNLNAELANGWFVDAESVRLIPRPGGVESIYFYCTLYRFKAGEWYGKEKQAAQARQSFRDEDSGVGWQTVQVS
jgi:hypothetical protein